MFVFLNYQNNFLGLNNEFELATLNKPSDCTIWVEILQSSETIKIMLSTVI